MDERNRDDFSEENHANMTGEPADHEKNINEAGGCTGTIGRRRGTGCCRAGTGYLERDATGCCRYRGRPI